MRELEHRADYLGQLHTLKWFSEEQYIPSSVIDRSSLEGWKNKGAKTAWERAKDRVDQLLAQYEPSPMSEDLRGELRAITLKAARRFGMDKLPPLPTD
jgi:trimethylamine:corrinoid methyltransferase-like protein